MKLKSRIFASPTRSAFLMLSVTIIILRFYFPRFATNDVTAFLSWETFSHYLWLPAFFIRDDLGFHDFGWMEQLLRQYQPLIGYQQAVLQAGTSGQVLTSTMGPAMLLAPFFMAGHVFAILSGYSADGFSAPYQVAMAVGGLSWSILGIWMMRRVLLTFFPEKISAITMIAVVPVTGYLSLAAFNGASSENLLFTLYLALVFATIRQVRHPSYGRAAVVGLVAGLVLLSSPFSIILVVPFLFYLAFRLTARHAHLTAIAIFTFLLITSIQFIYWKIQAGTFYFETGPFMTGSMNSFIPFTALATIPAGFMVQYLAKQKRLIHYPVVLAVCFVAGWNLYHSLQIQFMLDDYITAPARFFYRYTHEEAIPESRRYLSGTYIRDEGELLDHPGRLKTRRIFSLESTPVRMDVNCRFSTGISSPLQNYSSGSWIGLKARARVFCEGPAAENPGFLVTTLLRDGKSIQWKGTPLNAGNPEPGRWNEISLNYVIHDPMKDDILQVYVWYTGNRQALVGSLAVTLFELRDAESPP